jgi:hypothetical protein
MRRRIGKLVCRIARRHRWRRQQVVVGEASRSTAHHVEWASVPECSRCGAIAVEGILFGEHVRTVPTMAVPRGRRRGR